MSEAPGPSRPPPLDGQPPAPAGHPTPPLSAAEAAAAAAAAAAKAAEAAKTAAAAAAAAAEAAAPGSTYIPAQRSTEVDALAKPQQRRQGRLRGSLKVLAAFIAVVCVVGSVLGYFAYDRATRIDRSSPAVVIEQYVYAIFEPAFAEHSPKTFECPELAEDGLRGLVEELKELEARYSIDVKVWPGQYQVTTSRISSDVATDLYIEVPEVTGRSSVSKQRWLFELEDRDGWRVCATRRVS